VALHELPLDPAYLHGHFSRELEPVLTIDAGDSVRFAVPNAGWEQARGEAVASRNPDIDTGHPLAGPIEVRGARAGQTLVVQIDEVAPSAWGVTHSEGGHRIDWELRGRIGAGAGQRVRLAPFLGVMGMPPPEPGVHSTIPPRPWGGNIDCKELVAGTTLFLPIPVDGALFSAGDGHAAQGDGEVSGTAIEAPVEAQVTLDLRDDLPLEWPVARIKGAWLTFGFDEHLGRAAKIAVEGMLALMHREHGLERPDGLALASVVVDLRVTQVVNQSLGVHAVLRDDAFLGDRLRLWLEQGESGFFLRDAASGEPVRWEDPRLRVVPVAGVTYRAEALPDASFDPGRRLALVPEPTNEHDPNAVAIWNEERTLQVGYVPAAIAPELGGDEQAISLWRVEGGLRVLIVPADAWVGTPR
jgi:acetamidase/formamidase